MGSRWQISRRTMLRGLGGSMALPLVDAMAPASRGTLALAGEAAAGPAASAAATSPLRMAMFFLPNGMNMGGWTPASEGPLSELPATLKPLEALREQVTVLSGLACDNARAKGDGPG